MSIGARGGDLSSLAGKKVSEVARVRELSSIAGNEVLLEGGELSSITLSSRVGGDLSLPTGKEMSESTQGGDLSSLCPNSFI